MSDLRFKVGDMLVDTSGVGSVIGEVVSIHPGNPVPYVIRIPSGILAGFHETPTTRVASTRPIQVFQCKDDCCMVRVPSKRFWYVRTPKGKETFDRFRMAAEYAGYIADQIPQEVTA